MLNLIKGINFKNIILVIMGLFLLAVCFAVCLNVHNENEAAKLEEVRDTRIAELKYAENVANNLHYLYGIYDSQSYREAKVALVDVLNADLYSKYFADANYQGVALEKMTVTKDYAVCAKLDDDTFKVKIYFNLRGSGYIDNMKIVATIKNGRIVEIE